MRRLAVLFVCYLWMPLVGNGCSEDSQATQGNQDSAAGSSSSASGTSGPPSATEVGGSSSSTGAGGSRAATGNSGSRAATGRQGRYEGSGRQGRYERDRRQGRFGRRRWRECNQCSFPASTTPAAGSPRGVIVDAAQISGTIHSLQGVHWDPGVKGSATSNNYVAMGVDMIRTHDASGIGGTGTGDIDATGTGNMFLNMNADSTQESSYNFGPTDQLIKNILDVGAEVYFRVGRSNIGMRTVFQRTLTSMPTS